MPVELKARVVKEIVYRYRGHELCLPLTHSLFSSAGVDSGTNQLLTLLARRASKEPFDDVVDIGCGTGVLGVALARSYNARLRAVDRDAMAVAWTQAAAQGNGVEGEVFHAVTTTSLDPRERSLVASNLPAKAGKPVLEGLLGEIARLASRSGSFAAVVIVLPLSDWLSKSLEHLGATTVAESRSANHHSVLFEVPGASSSTIAQADVSSERILLPPRFIRVHGGRFVGPIREYAADTVHNLPEFDQLSFRLALAFDILRSVSVSGSVLIRGLRQGHLAVGISQRATGGASLMLTDRDLLALRATEHNCENRIEVDHVLPAPTLASVPRARRYDWLVVDEDPEPGTPWDDELVSAVEALLHPKGKLLLVGRSTTLTRVAKKSRALLKGLSERRMRGYRAELLVRKR